MQSVFLSLTAHAEPFHKLALEYGRYLAIGSHGMLGIAAQSCENLRGACELLCAYIKIRAEGTMASITETDKGLTLVISDDPEFFHPDVPEVSQFFELMLLTNFEYFCKTVMGNHIPNERLTYRLSQQLPTTCDVTEYFELGDLEFDHHQLEFFVPKNWLQVPLIQDNAELRKLAAQKCEMELQSLSPKDFIQEIRDRIRVKEGTKPSIEAMADQLFMSTSTLQRKLKQQNTTYQTIKQQERLLEAQQLLADDSLSIEDITEMLGFSDSSNFSKSFKSWTGMTPSNCRSHKNS